ncbi:tyrosine--tRNA ligase [Thermoproteota archaeon]
MDIDEKIGLVAQPPVEEVVTLEDLRHLFETESHPSHYIGLEMSGLLHLGSLILTGFKINDFIEAGIKCRILLADWHSYINNKFNGDLDKIRIASKYYEEAFKFFCPEVDIITGSELISHTDDYWENLVRFSKNTTLSRNTRCLTIMGRNEKESLNFAQYLYPPMQAVDIQALNSSIVHAGMDQRKVHMLARDIFPKMGWKVPVAVHHHLLPGLSEPDSSLDDSKVSSKMSKSKPWTCVFIHDDEKEVELKMKKAWCPEGLIENNPILEIAKYISFHESDEFIIDRPQKFGGPLSFTEYSQLENIYREKKLHPADLKIAVANSINRIIEPIRNHFKSRIDEIKLFESGA